MPAPRILCIAPNWLGDAILARPALALLGRSGAAIEIDVRAGLARVLEDLPGVTSLHVRTTGSRGARLLAGWRLRRRRCAAVLVLPPSFSAALAARCSGARVRVGFDADGRRRLLSHALTDPGRDMHLASAFVQLAQALLEAVHLAPVAVPALEPPRMPLLVAQPDELEAAARLRRDLGVEGGKTLVVAPGARYGPTKRYPAERFARAAADIAGPRAWRVLLVGEAADADATRAVAALLPDAVDLAGRTSLAELVGLLAGAGGVLANDSGTMHLAAALGAAVVGVFGSTNPRWTGPLGARSKYVVHAVPCAPCYAPECRTDFGCMLSLPASALVEAWCEVGAPVPPPDGRTSPAGARP